ncbi:hypothetical protein [Spirillospora sp. NPDC048823]|uniref:hypothetical protein n=1 Tax=unclassified Spirillospora TaxID=2642701 RepID=UPI0037106B53
MAHYWAGTAELISVLSGLAGILSFALSVIVDVVSRRDRSPHFRKISGWLLSLLGLITAGTFAVELVVAGLAVRWTTHALPVAGFCGGVVLAVAGTWRALTLPADRKSAPVRQIVEALADGVNGPARPPVYKPLPTLEQHSRRKPLRSRTLITWARKARMGLVTVESPAGGGKSVEFRETTRILAERATRGRRVKVIPVYIDLARVFGSDPAPSVNALHEYIREIVRNRGEHLLDELDLHLQGAREHVQWVIFVDSFHSIDPAVRERAWQAIADLARPSSFRALVAIRTSSELPGVRRRLEFAYTSPSWRRAVLRSFSLTPELRARLQRWTEVTDLQHGRLIVPSLFWMLAEHFEQAEVSALEVHSFHDVLDAIIERRLSRQNRPEEARLLAEELAYGRFAGRTWRADEPELIGSLMSAGLLVVRDDQPLGFSDASLLTHFAARRILRVPGETATDTLLANEAWRVPAIGVLKRCTEPQLTELLTAATALLDREAAGCTNLVNDIQPHLLGPAGLQPDTQSATFDWPPTARHILLTLAEGLRFRTDVAIPSALTALADRFVVSAFLPYVMPYGRADAVRVLSLCSTDVAKWAFEGCLTLDHGMNPRKVAAEQLTSLPGVFDQLGIGARIIAVAATVSDAGIYRRVLRQGAFPGSGALRSLSDVSMGVIRVLQAVSIYVVVIYSALFIIDVVQWSKTSETRILLIIASLLFLRFTLTGGRAIHPFVGIGATAVLAVFALLGALSGVLLIGPALFLICTGNADDGLSSAVSAYLTTWPLAMAYRIIDDARRLKIIDFAAPHLGLVRPHLIHSIRTAIPQRYTREQVAQNMRDVVVMAVAVGGVIGLLVGISEADLPRVEGVAEEDLRESILGGAVIGLLGMGLLWGYARNKIDILRARSKIAGGVGDEELLTLLMNQRNDKVTDDVFKVMASLPPGTMGAAHTALRDLYLALTHVDRFVQADSKKPIQKAIWSAEEPRFYYPSFREWIIEYDERHPGRLIKLAGKGRERLGKAADLAWLSAMEKAQERPRGDAA